MPPETTPVSGLSSERTHGAHFDVAARSLRWVFFCTGVPIGMLVPRLAEIKAGLGTGNAAYGTAIAIGGLGALFGNVLGGRLTHSLGSKRVAQNFVIFILLANVANALAPSVEWLAFVAFMGGFTFSTNNIALNSQAVLIEQGLGHSYVPRAHAFWSLGTMSAALTSSLLAPHLTPVQSLTLGATLSFIIYQWAARGLLTTEHEDRPGDDPAQLPRHESIPKGALRFLALLAIAQTLGLIAEISVGDWSSVLLHQDFHIAVGPNGYGFTAFMILQLSTRLYATRWIDRFGLQQTVRTLGTVGTAGYLICLVGAAASANGSSAVTLILSCTAYAFLGIAVAPMPSAFTSAAGSIPGLPSARALTVTGMIVAVLGMVGRIAFANLAQLAPLALALTFMGVLVLITVSMTFVLLPERAAQHAIER
jgi:hypothetical protein